MMKKACAIIMALGVSVQLSACSPVGMAMGAGATLGVAAAQEGGVRQAATDTKIRLSIHDLWFSHNVDMYRYLDMTVKEGRVLVTGTVPNPDMRVDAIRLAWQAKDVSQVINEINVDKNAGVKAYLKDTWITSRLKTVLTLDKHVQSINYTVDTVNGTVYLMGVAQDAGERDRVVNHARNMSHVDSVVSYVRLRTETPDNLRTAAAY